MTYLSAPVAVLLQVTGNVLAGEAFRAGPHALQNLAGDGFVNTQSLHSTHKLVMQLACPLNLGSNRAAQHTKHGYERAEWEVWS